MSLAQQIFTKFTNTTGGLSRAGAVAIVNKGGNKSAVTITRPANTTAYTALDVVGQADEDVAANAGSAILEFLNAGDAGGFAKINSADIRVDLAAIPASMTTMLLHLYDAAPDAVLDNAAFALSSAGDRGKYLGSITFTPADLGATLWHSVDAVNKQVKLADGSTSLFGVLQTTGGYTPTSGEVIRVSLNLQSL